MRAVDLNRPIPGFYLVKLVKGGPDVACLIYRPCPILMHLDEPWEWLDRWPRLEADLYGVTVPIDRIWPGCAKRPITFAEYQYRSALVDWCNKFAPHAPEANPREAIDFNTMETIF